MPAFDGVRVLELGQIYNGPYYGLLLAQLGADVIKVEPPGGEPLRFRSHEPVESHEFVLNSSKRGVVLDLKTDAGRQALLDLVETADVLIENYAPGTIRRLQLQPGARQRATRAWWWPPARRLQVHRSTRTCPPWTSRCRRCPAPPRPPGSPPGRRPRAAPRSWTSPAASTLFAAISAALFQRERTRRGQIVEVSMHDTIYPMLASSLGALLATPSGSSRTHREPALGHGGRAVQHLPGERRMAGDHLHLRTALARRGNRTGPGRADRRPQVPHDEPGRRHRWSTRRCRPGDQHPHPRRAGPGPAGRRCAVCAGQDDP